MFQCSPPHRKACRAKYPMLDRIESKIFLLLLFFNACRSDTKSPISPITVFEIVRLVWTIWCVYKDLIWRAELCLCRFQFASYCCRWLQIIFISGLIFDSDCFFDYTRLCVSLVHGFTHGKSVPYLFFRHLKQDLNSKCEILIHLLKKLSPVNDINGVLYVVDFMWIFSARIWEDLQF